MLRACALATVVLSLVAAPATAQNARPGGRVARRVTGLQDAVAKLQASLETVNATVATLQSDLAAANERIEVLETDLATAHATIADLQVGVDDIAGNSVLALDDFLVLGDYYGSPTARFQRVNVQIVNGTGATHVANNTATGNLIVGYNELRPPDSSEDAWTCSIGGYLTEEECPGQWALNHRIGSHNLIVGYWNNHSQYGGLIAGSANTVNGERSVAFGRWNVASGVSSTVTGGRWSTASGDSSTVCGGSSNRASGWAASVSGGRGGKANGEYSTVSGGQLNVASGEESTVSGGFDNEARGKWATVSGGYLGLASGLLSAVSGGAQNTADGFYSSVSGGAGNEAFGDTSTVSGGWWNQAVGECAVVSGGSNNYAVGKCSTVSGGEQIYTGVDYEHLP
jgi:hypothetical protein